MDVIGVFDPGAAEKNELEFWPNVYPHLEQPKYEIEYYLCFIGKDKGRKNCIENL